MMRRLDRLACRLFLASIHCSRLFARSPPISVSIQATWEEPPLLIQILESAALERPKSFFTFLDAICSAWTFKSSEPVTDQKLYEFITRTLASPGLLDGPGEYDSLATSVALKEAHPKIEAFRAWYASLPSNLTHQGSRKEDDSSPSKNDCESWVYLDGQKICEATRLTEILDSEKVQGSTPVPPRVLPFDHHHGPSSAPSAPTVILYASADPCSFGPLHKVLLKASQQVPPKATYVFRWKVSSPENAFPKSHSASYLSGWGAGLDIKKSEYLTLDDRPVESGSSDQAQLVAQSQDQSPGTIGVQGEKSKLTPLKAAEILDIGLKATQHVLSSPDPLAALRKLSQDFPKHAHALVTEWVPGNTPAELRNELEENSEEGISPGRSAVWMNGLELSSIMSWENLNFFKLVEIMRNERRWIISLVSLGLSPVQARTLIADDKVNSAMNPDTGTKSEGLEMNASILGERFDASDRQEGGGAIIWWNDLESDARYAGWPSHLRYILRPTFPGQLQAIARNMINVVVALDLTQISSLKTLGNIIEPFISRNLPIRWGFVPISPKEPGREELLWKSLWNMTDSIGPMETLKFIKEFFQSLETDTVDIDQFISQANEVILATVDSSPTEEEVHEANESKEERYQTWLHKAKLYTSRLALCSSDYSIPACMLINGRFFPMDDDFRSHLQHTAMLHTQFLQHQVYFDLLEGDTDVASYLYDLPLVHPSRNDFVIPSETRPLQFSNMMDALDDSKDTSAQVFFGNEAISLKSDKAQSTALIWLVGNLDSESGVAAVAAVLSLLIRPLPEVSVQVAFVHTPTGKDEPTDMSTALATLLSSTSGSKISCNDVLTVIRRHGLDVVAPEDKAQKVADETEELLVKSSLGGSQTIVAEDAIWSGSKAFSKSLGIKSDELAIVINGRVLNVSPNQKLTINDLSMLVEYENEKRTSPMLKALEQLDGHDLLSQPSKTPMVVSVVGSVLVSSEDSPFQMTSNEGRSASYRSRPGNHSSLQLGDATKALFDFGVILNPAGEAAQGWAALLEVLSRRSDVVMKVWLNPSLEVNELPIKRFFRTSISNCLEFDEDGHIISPGVTFQDIPPETLLTLAIDTPPAWLALSQDSVHDLDNIMLSELPSAYGTQGVEAVFQLEHIIIAGHARELPSEMPPRGLQIVLKDLLRDREVDTIIMANLGYFQFKSAPGLHRLTIRPGRSSELYEIETVHSATQKANETTDVKSGGDEEQICLTTFNGLTLFPRFRKRPEKMDESLIQPITAESSSSSTGAASELTKLVGQVKDLATGMFGNKLADVVTGGAVQSINIFTVASGLLYERMAYLMCVSVMRHTKSPVKFWFISNFLSPSFKRFIPHLAREYGFDYQLVTYRWPPWLRAQKEKQRVIWGYKILFLDVLFPLEIDRVIFVDSDQIVRTDLKALVDLDLRGAPYAYAPMCNDRNETKGFRFWDTGYWKDSLQGRPYHISALYVVDLRVFRAIAAGDQLRQHYQALSADPGSLANLDQDLPNNMQSALPIFTLDQSWLWCETWCSDDGLKVAKTIDLCNNPLTHEPKLKRARRLIPEWDVYDQEVAALAARVKRDNQDQSAAKMTVQAGERIGDDNGPDQDEKAHSKDEL